MRKIFRPAQLRLLPLLLGTGALLILFSFGAAMVTRHLVVIPQLHELEAQADRRDLRRALLAIESKNLQLATLAYQSAIDDSMHALALSPAPDQDRLDANAPSEMLSNFHVDFIAVFNREQQLVARRISTEVDSPFYHRALPVADLQPLLFDLSRVEQHAPLFRSGITQTANGPIMYAVASIMRRDTTGEAAGNLMLATILDRGLAREITRAAQLEISFSAPSAADLQTPLTSPDTVYRNARDQVVWLLRDERGQAILQMTLALPQRQFGTEAIALPVLVSFASTLIGLSLLILVFRHFIIQPMLGVGRHLRAVRESGNYGLRLNNFTANELGDLSRDIDALVQHVQVQQDQLQAQTTTMQLLSFQDGLTGLANRRRFDQALADNWAHAQRAQAPLALIMFDVDYFKNYNDHYGHQRGDEALQRLAQIVLEVVVRQSDVAARYGGEEFAILLPQTTEYAAAQIAARLQQAVKKAAIAHPQSRIADHLTVSIGIAALVPDSDTAQRDLIHRADAALYSSKASGRNRITRASQLPG